MDNQNFVKSLEADIIREARTRFLKSERVSLIDIKAVEVSKYYEYMFKDISKNANSLYEIANSNLQIMEKTIPDLNKSGVLSNLSIESAREAANIKIAAHNRNNKRINDLIIDCFLQGYADKGRKDFFYYKIWQIPQIEKVFEYLQERQKVENNELAERATLVRCISAECKIPLTRDKIANIEILKLYAQCISDEDTFKQEKLICNDLENKYKSDLEKEKLLDEQYPDRHNHYIGD